VHSYVPNVEAQRAPEALRWSDGLADISAEDGLCPTTCEVERRCTARPRKRPTALRRLPKDRRPGTTLPDCRRVALHCEDVAFKGIARIKG
jgi:hypothetical protein